jgi:hypothetical protein
VTPLALVVLLLLMLLTPLPMAPENNAEDENAPGTPRVAPPLLARKRSVCA